MLVRSQLFTQISINQNDINFNNDLYDYKLSELIQKNLISLELSNNNLENELYYIEELENDVELEEWLNEYTKTFTKKIKKLMKNFYKLNLYKTTTNVKLNLIYLKYINYYNFRNYFLINKRFNKIIYYYLFMLNIKKKKPFVNITLRNKTLLSVSTGFLLKKLNIEEKKSKKSLKTLYLLLKIVINNLNKNFKNYQRIICNIKGSKKRLFQIIIFLKKKINFNNIIFIYTPNFYQNSIKFKKIKSIKRRLRKKFINK